MKITFLSVCLLALIFTFSTQTFAVDFTINLTTDESDANALDFICDVDLTTPGEQCTLRAAVDTGNLFLVSARYFFNLPSNSTITLNGRELEIVFPFELIGTGAKNLTIDGGAGSNRVFRTSGAAIISDVTLTGGNGEGSIANGVGGAINAGSSLTLNRVHITGNSAELPVM